MKWNKSVIGKKCHYEINTDLPQTIEHLKICWCTLKIGIRRYDIIMTSRGKPNISETARTLDKRLNAHRKQPTSAVCKHQTKSAHSIKREGVKGHWESVDGQRKIKRAIQIWRQRPLVITWLMKTMKKTMNKTRELKSFSHILYEHYKLHTGPHYCFGLYRWGVSFVASRSCTQHTHWLNHVG